jgi:hypothetical protein
MSLRHPHPLEFILHKRCGRSSVGKRGINLAKSSALPYALRGLGIKGGVSHLSSVVFGDARFNRSSSSVDMRRSNLKFCLTPRDLVIEAFPKATLKEIDSVLTEAQREVQRALKNDLQKSDFPNQWDSGQVLQVFLYSSIRLARPKYVIETGTANGKSTSAICAALLKNGFGHLWSFDVLKSEAPYVTKSQRKCLTLVKYNGKGSSLRNEIRRIIESDDCKIFFHDSDHSYPNQFSDYRIASEFGFDLLISDDVDASMAFCDFAESAGSVALDSSKFIGFVSNPAEATSKL